LPIQKINHLPIPVSLIVSSSDWHFSFTEDEGLDSAHVSEIVCRLMRIACLPAELLEENECSLDKFIPTAPCKFFQEGRCTAGGIQKFACCACSVCVYVCVCLQESMQHACNFLQEGRDAGRHLNDTSSA
jgi:hypothetical protein